MNKLSKVLNTVTYTCNLNTLGWRQEDHEFEASLDFLRPRPNNKIKVFDV